MPDDGGKGAFSADIPADAIAEALAAVEKRPRAGEGRDDGPPPAEAPAPRDAAGAPPAAPAGEAERLRAELELSQERGRKMFEQLREEHDRLLRAAADLENYRKRAAREKDEVQRYGNERLLKELLPVLDNLERALAATPPSDPLASGVELTRRLLLETLARFGVKGFSARGERFDPRLHEALMTVATGEHAPGTVVEEQHCGYFLHDRLIRAAAVVVAAAAAGGGDPPGEA